MLLFEGLSTSGRSIPITRRRRRKKRHRKRAKRRANMTVELHSKNNTEPRKTVRIKNLLPLFLSCQDHHQGSKTKKVCHQSHFLTDWCNAHTQSTRSKGAARLHSATVTICRRATLVFLLLSTQTTSRVCPLTTELSASECSEQRDSTVS